MRGRNWLRIAINPPFAIPLSAASFSASCGPIARSSSAGSISRFGPVPTQLSTLSPRPAPRSFSISASSPEAPGWPPIRWLTMRLSGEPCSRSSA